MVSSGNAALIFTITACLLQSPQDAPLQVLQSLTASVLVPLRSDNVTVGHVNRFCYLLTYLLLVKLRTVSLRDQLWTVVYVSSSLLLL